MTIPRAKLVNLFLSPDDFTASADASEAPSSAEKHTNIARNGSRSGWKNWPTSSPSPWAAFILDNHLHVLLRIDPLVADGWSDEEVVRRWGRLFPPSDKQGNALQVSDEWVKQRLADEPWLAEAEYLGDPNGTGARVRC